jgi:hypothetical protein
MQQLMTVAKIAGAFGAIVTVFGSFWVLGSVYFKIEYVLDVVNPDSLIEYRSTEAVLETKRAMRWCLGKAVLLDDLDRRRILDCAD